jgi:archaellin
MIYIHRITFWGMLILNTVLAVAVINLGAFAQQGARYTAEDGARDRMERINTDLALAARIDELHNILAEREAP